MQGGPSSRPPVVASPRALAQLVLHRAPRAPEQTRLLSTTPPTRARTRRARPNARRAHADPNAILARWGAGCSSATRRGPRDRPAPTPEAPTTHSSCKRPPPDRCKRTQPTAAEPPLAHGPRPGLPTCGSSSNGCAPNCRRCHRELTQLDELDTRARTLTERRDFSVASSTGCPHHASDGSARGEDPIWVDRTRLAAALAGAEDQLERRTHATRDAHPPSRQRRRNPRRARCAHQRHHESPARPH